MGFGFVPASTGGLGPELAHKRLESQIRLTLLSENEVFFIIEVICVNVKRIWEEEAENVKRILPQAIRDELREKKKEMLQEKVAKFEPKEERQSSEKM
ncbi:hypothetical protein AVEN_127734-1 [Araneus ventricosus]|uniref:Uncharacterized protein n=1 Tax=Araneus ventricosus TaxID=182803 RepID=A0A4Y2ECA9_ARAVE|nr:hypothetical protein AVEN_127734-1 [Araneus ventricosus]